MAGVILDIVLLCAGVALLYFGAEWLVRGAARLAGGLGVSPIVIGLTVVSLGTSAPELVVCVVATLQGNGDLAVGNVLGSNLANLGLILGVSALVRPMAIAARVVSRELPIMLLVTAFLYPLMWDGQLDMVDGGALLAVLLIYLAFVGWTAGEEEPEVLGEYEQFAEESAYLGARAVLKDFGLVLLGGGGVVLGGELIVETATTLAMEMGISDLVVGLSVVAVGTSLPELATSMVAAIREEADIAVGNIIGSNIFNVAAVLGAASTLRPITVPESVLTVELPAVLILSALVIPVTLGGMKVDRWEGALLLSTYVGIGLWVFL